MFYPQKAEAQAPHLTLTSLTRHMKLGMSSFQHC
jgi:hypothetical protein